MPGWLVGEVWQEACPREPAPRSRIVFDSVDVLDDESGAFAGATTTKRADRAGDGPGRRFSSQLPSEASSDSSCIVITEQE